jgi:hypothetical protein
MSRQLIPSHPNIMRGEPVVAGTRVTVELILEKLAAGECMDQLLEAYAASPTRGSWGPSNLRPRRCCKGDDELQARSLLWSTG